MNTIRNTLMIMLILFVRVSMADEFYSAGDGNWNNANTWSATDGGAGGHGIPATGDTVIIRSGDVVSIPGSYTVGPVPASVGNHQSQGGNHFIHDGKLTVRSGGTLQKTAGGTYLIFDGKTDIFGTLDTNNRLYNLGEMEIHPGATASIGNDLVLADVSSTVIDVDLDAVDDLYFVGTDATLCGSGSITLGTSSGSKIQEFDGADAVNQMCAGFPVHNDGNEGDTTSGENATLPITLIVFKVLDDKLYWDVIEENVLAYEVHYAKNGNQWEKYGELKAHGTGHYQYSFPISKEGFYRIMSVEEVPEFSPIVYFTGIPAAVKIFPNMAKENEDISILGEEIQRLEFVNRSGQIMKTVTDKFDVVHLNLKPDVYYVRVYQPVSVTTRRLIIM